MVYIERWKATLIALICVLGIFGALPNVVPQSVRDSLSAVFLPSQTVNLGLDLQGGSYLLLEVDVPYVVRERMESLTGDIRTAMREANAGYTGLRAQGETVTLRIREEAQIDAAVAAIEALANPVGQSAFGGAGSPDIAVERAADGVLNVRLTDEAVNAMRDRTVEASLEVVRRRVDELGTREPTITRQGEERILLQVPGIDDPARLREVVGRTAKMTFHLVDTSIPPQDAAEGRVPPGLEALPSDDPVEPVVVIQRRAMLTGDRLESAGASQSQDTGEPVVTFRFDSAGAKRFGDITQDNVGRRFAIVLDGRVVSAPVIREPILGGSGQISGNFTYQEANDLALVLRAGALPAPLTILEERTVGAELGADSVAAGEIAGVIGLVLVLVFIVASYGLFGVFAAVALLLNLILILAALSILQATLTLPGIAGIILTLGMAVDANVLVFERIREEVANGKSPINAIDSGYQRALSAIADANITTFLAVLILFQLGSGPVRGFAVTLGIGIITSVFSAIMVTRLMVVLWLRARKPKALPL